MTPWLNDPDVRLYHGDALEVLRQLPSASVHMCATSPPFYGLRDYGSEGQIGLEETPDQWVARLVSVFREVRRVLRDDGVLFVEVGDSFNSIRHDVSPGRDDQLDRKWAKPYEKGTGRNLIAGLKQKDLIGQPWLLAFALRADGWYLRSEIIWARPNPMPESVTDRPTKSHSTVFMLSKRPRYFYDADAIREAFNQASADRAAQGYNHAFASQFRGHPTDKRHVDGKQLPPATLDGSNGEAPRGPDGRRVTAVRGGDNSEQHRDGERWPNPSGANARSVWQIATEPTPFAHFATWPRKLVARMILAGTSERGCCPECGAPWVRNVEREPNPTKSATGPNMVPIGPNGKTDARYRSHSGSIAGPPPITLGWSPSCVCFQYSEGGGNQEHLRSAKAAATPDPGPVPAVVLDPFAGSGTTLLVARQHGRHSIGIELNADYCRLVAERTQQQSLLADGVA